VCVPAILPHNALLDETVGGSLQDRIVEYLATIDEGNGLAKPPAIVSK
jgi:hypothetical protein